MDCPHVPELNYGSYSKKIKDKVKAKHIPLAFGIEVTYRCNLKCVHCYIDKSCFSDEMSKSDITSILDQAAEEGALWLLLTGGEPFARKDFKDIYLYAKKKGFLITLFTNGTTVTSEIADFLAQWPPYVIEITLYGATEPVYEAVTGVKGSYKKCRQGIDLILKHKLNLRLKSMILKTNVHELKQMREFAEKRGLSYRYDALINPKLDGSKEPAAYALKPKEVVELDISDEKRKAAFKSIAKKVKIPQRNGYVFMCSAGTQSFNVTPQGQMGICILAREKSYDLRKGTLKEGWHKHIPKVRSQKNRFNYPCSKCELIVLCGQCPGWAQLEHGEQEKPVEYLCEVAHLRAKTFGIEAEKKANKASVPTKS